MSRKCTLHVDAFDRFEQEFFHLLCQNMFSSTHDCFLSVNTLQFFLLERIEISNICSHSMHVCETLWSGSDWADRKDFAKINGAAPADPFSTLGTHDTPSRGPIWTLHGRVVVFAARAHRVCFELMVNA